MPSLSILVPSKMIELPSISSQIIHFSLLNHSIMSKLWLPIKWIHKITITVILSWIKQWNAGNLVWRFYQTGIYLPSYLAQMGIFAIQNLYYSSWKQIALHTWIERIILKEHPEAVLWAKVEVILNFNTFWREWSSKQPP